MRNALSFDVEEYFMVTGFDEFVNRDEWDEYPQRLEVGMDRILNILEEHETRATFFFLGWIARRHPSLVREVANRGHEIASHGDSHRVLYELTPADFAKEVQRSLDAIGKAYDGRVTGFRAPSFSIREETLWALEILEEFGFEYDSSIFPCKRQRYGMPAAPRFPYKVGGELREFPLSTVEVFGRRIPVCGGGYLRLYPLPVTRWAIDRINQKEGRPVVVYLHPWEFDPDQPRLEGDVANRFRHWVNIRKTPERLSALCSEYDFAPLREVLGL